MVHIWFHMGEKQAAVLAKQTAQPQDFALRSLGVIRAAQSPLCITKQGSLCALGFPFVLHSGPSQCSATIYHFIPNKPAHTQLKDWVLPSCFPSPGKCSSCLRARVMTHQHFLSKSGCCLFQSFPLPSPESGDAERQQVLELGEHVVWQPGPAPLLHPSLQKMNKKIKEFSHGPLKTKKLASCRKRNPSNESKDFGLEKHKLAAQCNRRVILQKNYL